MCYFERPDLFIMTVVNQQVEEILINPVYDNVRVTHTHICCVNQ